MPCIFLKNVPNSLVEELNRLKSDATNIFMTQKIFEEIADAAGCRAGDVEIHITNEVYQLLSYLGVLADCPNIHGFVVWFGQEKRDAVVKQRIADALQHFLNQHGVGQGFDLTFIDMPAGSFFVEKDGQSVMVEGGEILPPFSIITEAIVEVTGFGRDK